MNDNSVEPFHQMEIVTSSEMSSVLMEAETSTTNTADMKTFAAKWILKTRETRNLTKAAMQGIIKDTSDMLAFATSSLKTDICAKLSAYGVDPGVITELDTIFKGPALKPFDGISSFHQQLQYYRHYFNLVVSYNYACYMFIYIYIYTYVYYIYTYIKTHR